ncbi:MAG: chaperone NapD [Myxococcota bacterium]|nr:chaperone NapD [Myxococcota bacterium]
MRFGGIVVQVRPGAVDQVAQRVAGMSGVEIASQTDEGLALVISGSSPAVQEERHRTIAALPGVVLASVVFQSCEV